MSSNLELAVLTILTIAKLSKAIILGAIIGLKRQICRFNCRARRANIAVCFEASPVRQSCF